MGQIASLGKCKSEVMDVLEKIVQLIFEYEFLMILIWLGMFELVSGIIMLLFKLFGKK